MRKLFVAINKNWQTAKFATQQWGAEWKEKVCSCWKSRRKILKCNRITPWENFLIGLSLYNACDTVMFILSSRKLQSETHYMTSAGFVEREEENFRRQSLKNHQKTLWYWNWPERFMTRTAAASIKHAQFNFVELA